ncbi:electron transfer flavoprotein regulatory factor 1 [Eupeodes corollae]|uniref:electron transfer flavoprotein regulatory factor 1 n=1 Tax=Eupeodes corollae TaxID=290404 RepID=UPI00249216D5|nr:electron transfer flavoprotein regulatory factor 1 [Eupeodes corollae]
MSEVRTKVLQLYKQLQFLGREYPGGANKFRQQCHDAFIKNKNVQDPKQIMALVAKGRYVAKELEALYSLKKYRAMKQRYQKN